LRDRFFVRFRKKVPPSYDEEVLSMQSSAWMRVNFSLLAIALIPAAVVAQSYSAPAGVRQALRREGASILPGGRIIAPYGKERPTGPGPFTLGLSPSGRAAVTANTGPWRYTMTVLQRDRAGHWESREIDARSPSALDEFGIPKGQGGEWKGVSNGVAFSGERAIWVSEGNSGRVALYDSAEDRRRAIDLNTGGFADSYTGALAFDSDRDILYVADQANFRVAVVDTKSRQVLASVRVGRLPFALALSPDRQRLYVANVGVFQYRMVPDAGAGNARTAGLPFPPVGPASAPADVDAPEANSIAVLDVSVPSALKLEGFVRVGNSPSAVLATKDRVFVSCADDDSIAVIDPASRGVVDRIPIVIPGLEKLRGVIPLGMAYDEASGWLLVAEAGIDAVAVIDTRLKRVLGHIPAAWYPTSVAIADGEVLVANARGHGIGPDAPTAYSQRGSLLPSALFQGTVSIFSMPAPEDLAALTETVMRANGFAPKRPAMPAPPPVRHVVLIVKEGRTYDEVLGDIRATPHGSAMGDPEIARYGLNGIAEGGHQRLSLKGVRVTPNAHAIATQWSFSDNFYADGDGTVDGHHWLAGVYPNAWTETSLFAAYGNLKDFRMSSAPGRLAFPGMASSVLPEDAPPAATLWSHLADNRISFYNFGEGFDLPGAVQQPGMESLGARFLTDMPMAGALHDRTSQQYPGYNLAISDQERASAFIREVEQSFAQGAADLPQFLYVYLPGDAAGAANGDEGHPYKESFIADNDLALGRIIQYLSAGKWWKDTAVFVTESTAVGGIDHISANRTVLLAAGPWVKRGYVSHMNVSFPGLLKTIFWLLGAGPLNLFDASASDLQDCFASSPDLAQFHAVAGDPRIFAPVVAQ
jgi:YVTN family beta-propeller protein